MENIPTAEEVLREYNSHSYDSDWRTLVAMRKFAKLHVEAALKAAAINVSMGPFSVGRGVLKQSILTAYPIENIK